MAGAVSHLCQQHHIQAAPLRAARLPCVRSGDHRHRALVTGDGRPLAPSAVSRTIGSTLRVEKLGLRNGRRYRHPVASPRGRRRLRVVHPNVRAPQTSRHCLFRLDWIVHAPAARSQACLGHYRLHRLSDEPGLDQHPRAAVEGPLHPRLHMGLATTSTSGSPVRLHPTASSVRQRLSPTPWQPPAVPPSSRLDQQRHPPIAPPHADPSGAVSTLPRSVYPIAHHLPPHTITIHIAATFHLHQATRQNRLIMPSAPINITIHSHSVHDFLLLPSHHRLPKLTHSPAWKHQGRGGRGTWDVARAVTISTD